MVTDPALLGLDCLHNGQHFSLYHLLQPCTFLLWALFILLDLFILFPALSLNWLKNQIHIIFSKHLL